MREFDHERMDVYRLALRFISGANVVTQSPVPGRAALADQLDRAAVSIALNITEGAGEFSKREKARFYRIARRSATECAAILDVVEQLGLIDDRQVLQEVRRQLRTIVPMLIGLGKWAENEAPASPT
jgi:four helix bundle protein